VQPFRPSRGSVFLACAAGLAVVAFLVFYIPLRSSRSSPEDPALPSVSVIPRARLAKRACTTLGSRVLQRVDNGTSPTRSGQVQLVPTYPNFVDGGLTHASPYELTQHVPLFLYGHGIVRPGVYDRPASLTDISQTAASLLKFDGFQAPKGRSLDQALLPTGQRATPKLVITLIWDSAGMDLLDRWPDSWPYLKAFRAHGAWFSRAEVGSSPSNTPPSHATIGTGAYPRLHGMVDEYVMIDGVLQKPNEQGSASMAEPTFADVYDLAKGNRPLVAEMGSLSAHVMMMGHGLQWPGGDADIAIAREVEDSGTGGDDTGGAWSLTSVMAPYYTLPDYANDPEIDAVLERAKDDLDQADGKMDGKWRDQSIEGMHDGFNTPARTPYQTALFEAVIDHEGFGRDRVPDLLYLNYKIMDTLGHQFSADGVELSDALQVQDRDLHAFVDFLNDRVGKGQWVMLLTADHGMQRDPAAIGAFPIDIDDIEAALQGAFGGEDGQPVVIKARPTQIWLDEDVLASRGATLEDVSSLLLSLTQGETVGAVTPEPGHEDDRVFDAVFPSSLLDHMPCLHGDPAG